MDIEYSREVRNMVYAYRFELWERVLIAKCLRPELRAIQKKIERIKNDPRNEGQATYQVEIDSLHREKQLVQEIIDAMVK